MSDDRDKLISQCKWVLLNDPDFMLPPEESHRILEEIEEEDSLEELREFAAAHYPVFH